MNAIRRVRRLIGLDRPRGRELEGQALELEGPRESSSSSNAASLPRIVDINQENPTYRDNNLPTANYSIFEFFPATIFLLLRPDVNPANFYFLCIGLIQIVPQISQTRGEATTRAGLAATRYPRYAFARRHTHHVGPTIIHRLDRPRPPPR